MLSAAEQRIIDLPEQEIRRYKRCVNCSKATTLYCKYGRDISPYMWCDEWEFGTPGEKDDKAIVLGMTALVVLLVVLFIGAVIAFGPAY